MLLLFRRVVVGHGRALDRLFARRGPARPLAPVVIVGNPRSGTTFLHRFLVEHRVGVGLTVWDMLWTSRLLQALLAPLRPFAARRARTSGFSNVAHTTGPDHAESDDAAIMMHHVEGFFGNALLQGWDPAHAGNIFRSADPAARERAYAWWERLWRLDPRAPRIVAKAFSIATDAPAFLARFPGAKLLYTVRDPVEQIASAMSLNTIVLDRAFGFWSRPEPVRAAYLARLYGSFVDQLRRWHDDWTAGRIDRARVLIVPYPRLIHDLEAQLDEIFEFIGHVPDAALRAAIVDQADVQRNRISAHAYDLARFGLTAAQVERDCAFVTRAFLGDDDALTDEDTGHDTLPRRRAAAR
jgi:hypothetical protein